MGRLGSHAGAQAEQLTLPERPLDPRDAEVILRRRSLACARVAIPATFLRHDELRDALHQTLVGRYPAVKFKGDELDFYYFVPSASPDEAVTATKFARAVMQAIGAAPDALLKDLVFRLDTSDIDRFLTSEYLRPEE